MELLAGDSRIQYIQENNTLKFSGSMRLANMKEYDAVLQFIKESGEKAESEMNLDLSELQFLNSSGITTLSLFVLHCKKQNNPQITVHGNADVSWQQKSIANFQKLWSEVKINM